MNPTIKSGPGYWMNETGGQLVPAIQRYLGDEELSESDIQLIRAYLKQWIDAPVWDMNPSLDTEGRIDLAGLRSAARFLKTRADVEKWLSWALDIGIDPL